MLKKKYRPDVQRPEAAVKSLVRYGSGEDAF
jgi:hypothetical protein